MNGVHSTRFLIHLTQRLHSELKPSASWVTRLEGPVSHAAPWRLHTARRLNPLMQNKVCLAPGSLAQHVCQERPFSLRGRRGPSSQSPTPEPRPPAPGPAAARPPRSQAGEPGCTVPRDHTSRLPPLSQCVKNPKLRERAGFILFTMPSWFITNGTSF